MSLLLALARLVGKILDAQTQRVVAGRFRGSVEGVAVLGVLGAAIVSVAVPGVGIGAANGQAYDPVQVVKLLANDGGEDDRFGWFVSIDGDTAVIGTDQDDDNGAYSGSAYVFIRSGRVWSEQAKLLPNDGVGHDHFGASVSINGDTAIIGAAQDDDNGAYSGSAYVFTRSGSVWTQQAKLLPDDGAVGDWFGNSVSLSGELAIIGALGDEDNGNTSGSVYVFSRSGGVWTQQAKLLPDDGEEGDRFGYSVSLSGDTIVIGAKGDDDWSGSAYVFTHSGGAWSQKAKLLPDDGGEEYDQFGTSVSLSSKLAIIGALGDDDNGNASGAAYVFARSGGGVWTQQAKLLPDDGTAANRFGWSVSLSGDTAVIGAEGDYVNGVNSGSAYFFTCSGGVWTQRAKLLPIDGAEQDHFGSSVSISGNMAVIGAYKDDDNNTNSGSAYVWTNINALRLCAADLNDDGVVNTQDFLIYLGAWAAGEPLADWDGNGIIDTRDFVAFLGDWAAGC